MLFFHYFMTSVWPWISLERESYWRFILRKRSSQCHSNPVLVPHQKPSNTVKGIYDGWTFDLKKSVDIWTRMDVVPVEYGKFSQKFHLTMRFFKFITGVTFKWYYVLWCIIDLLVWIGL